VHRRGDLRRVHVFAHFDLRRDHCLALYGLDLSEFRDKPAGTIRITAVEHAAKTILCPALAILLTEYPDIIVEIVADLWPCRRRR
jgi:hypothetical protein